MAHVGAFVTGMCGVLGVELMGSTHGGAVFSIRLTDDIRDALGRRGNVVRLTADRRFASDRSGIEVLDAESSLLKSFLTRAKSLHFGGLTAAIRGMGKGAVITSVLRWQSDRGSRIREEYAAAMVNEEGLVSLNSEQWRQWLLESATDEDVTLDSETAKRFLSYAEKAFDRRLAAISSVDLHPEDRTPLSAGAVRGPSS